MTCRAAAHASAASEGRRLGAARRGVPCRLRHIELHPGSDVPTGRRHGGSGQCGCVGRSVCRRLGCSVCAASLLRLPPRRRLRPLRRRPPHRQPHRPRPAPRQRTSAASTLKVVTRSGSFDDTGTFKTAKESWEKRTGGKVTFNVFSEFSDFDKKYTGYIATKDSHDRRPVHLRRVQPDLRPAPFEDITATAGDTSDFVPGRPEDLRHARRQASRAAGPGRDGHLHVQQEALCRRRHRPGESARHLAGPVQVRRQAPRRQCLRPRRRLARAGPRADLVPDLLQLDRAAAPQRRPPAAAVRQRRVRAVALDHARRPGQGASSIRKAST